MKRFNLHIEGKWYLYSRRIHGEKKKRKIRDTRIACNKKLSIKGQLIYDCFVEIRISSGWYRCTFKIAVDIALLTSLAKILNLISAAEILIIRDVFR